MKKLKQNQKGFTLIELLVVIAIIGLLASVVLLALNSARQKSRDAKRVADVRQVVSALELYYNDVNSYPAALSSLATITNSGNQVYMGVVPTAPTPQDGGCSLASNAYAYIPTTAPATNYALTFCVGASTGGLGADMHTASPAGIQ